MTTPAAPVPGPLPASEPGIPAGDAAVLAAGPADTVPGSGSVAGPSGAESVAGTPGDEDDEYEPLV